VRNPLLYPMQHPRLTLLGLALATAVLGAGIPRLHSEFGYRVLLGDEHPSVKTLDSVIETFGGGLPLRIVWECGADQPCQTLAGAA
jgi:hypothetical protein